MPTAANIFPAFHAVPSADMLIVAMAETSPEMRNPLANISACLLFDIDAYSPDSRLRQFSLCPAIPRAAQQFRQSSRHSPIVGQSPSALDVVAVAHRSVLVDRLVFRASIYVLGSSQ